jgi:hypothetical protein
MAQCLKCSRCCVHLMDYDTGESYISEGFDPNITQYLYCGECGNADPSLFQIKEEGRFKTHADIFLRYRSLLVIGK